MSLRSPHNQSHCQACLLLEPNYQLPTGFNWIVDLCRDFHRTFNLLCYEYTPNFVLNTYCIYNFDYFIKPFGSFTERIFILVVLSNTLGFRSI